MKVHMGVTVLHPSRPVPTVSPTSEAGADASKKKKSCRLVPGTITIISGEGQMALNGCSFRVATGRVGEKTNKNNKKKANEKVADKVTEKVEVMQLG
ncbi:hypothetical protein FOBRF1_008272 [Fusarium oxysporum]